MPYYKYSILCCHKFAIVYYSLKNVPLYTIIRICHPKMVDHVQESFRAESELGNRIRYNNDLINQSLEDKNATKILLT